jgi:hypothetical protein
VLGGVGSPTWRTSSAKSDPGLAPAGSTSDSKNRQDDNAGRDRRPASGQDRQKKMIAGWSLVAVPSAALAPRRIRSSTRRQPMANSRNRTGATWQA